MKTQKLDSIIDVRLEFLGATSIPPAARHAIAADIFSACEKLISKRISGEYVGRMVARALTSREGCKGEDESSPLPSSQSSTSQQGAQIGVACHSASVEDAHCGECNARRPEGIPGEQ